MARTSWGTNSRDWEADDEKKGDETEEVLHLEEW